MALTTEELGRTTAAERGKKSGGPKGRAELAQGAGRTTRRVMRCGDWIRLGDAAEAAVRAIPEKGG